MLYHAMYVLDDIQWIAFLPKNIKVKMKGKKECDEGKYLNDIEGEGR